MKPAKTKSSIKNWRPFEEARAYVQTLGLKNQEEWKSWVKSNQRPDDIPAAPWNIYKDKGWISLGDWLGTGRIASFDMTFRLFEEARAYVHSLGLNNLTEWNAWCKSESRPKDIPTNPNKIYKDKGWIDTGDWLGTGRIASQKIIYRPFEEARKYVRRLNLSSKEDWNSWAKSKSKPNDIPADPSNTYKNKGWKSWGDWLGTNRIAFQDRIYLAFEDARSFVHDQNLKNVAEWSAWTKSSRLPENIPADPSKAYNNKGWISWGDWLGSEYIANKNREYRPYDEAKVFVRNLQLKNQEEWILWAKLEARPDDIPASPSVVYKETGWENWAAWLGITNKWTKRVYWASSTI